MPKKKTYRTVFIACEGSNTEPNYFGRLAENIDATRRLKVEVFPKPPILGTAGQVNRRSDPVGLVELAKQQLVNGTYDESWAVFDCDGHNGLAEAFQKAQEVVDGKTVRIAFSNIAFEHWILLHFERNATAYAKSADLIEDCFVRKNLYPTYGKNRLTDPYPVLADKTLLAIENAAWLRHCQLTALAAANGKVYALNPYTDVDELVKELLEIDLSVSWASFGSAISFAEYYITFFKQGQDLQVNFNNRSRTSIVFNDQNLAGFFSMRPVMELTLNGAVQIAPGETAVFNLHGTDVLGDNCVMIFKIGNQQLFVE